MEVVGFLMNKKFAALKEGSEKKITLLEATCVPKSMYKEDFKLISPDVFLHNSLPIEINESYYNDLPCYKSPITIKTDTINPGYYSGNTVRDFIELLNLTFSEGCVVKYIARYKNKNGLNDLQKARNYLEYILSNYTFFNKKEKLENFSIRILKTKEFVDAINLGFLEEIIIFCVLTHKDTSDIEKCLKCLDLLIENYFIAKKE